MSELVSAYPTSGGIYWWASKLGGPAAGFFTGWLNLIGLVAVTASVAYGCATFIDLTLQHVLRELGRGLLADPGVLDLPGRARPGVAAQHLQRPPDGDHEQRLGVVARRRRRADRADPDLRARQPPELQLRLHRAVQQLGLSTAAPTSGATYWLLVVPVRPPADAVHDHRLRRLRPPVGGDPRRRPTAAAKGIWQSIFYSAIGGWILLLAVPVRDPGRRGRAPGQRRGRWSAVSPTSSTVALGADLAAFVLFISAVGQFFCTVACMTSASRMTFAFSRDGAIPGLGARGRS